LGGHQGFRRDDRQMMSLDRPALLGRLATVLPVPDRARAATVTYTAQRSVPVPTRVRTRIPPAPSRDGSYRLYPICSLGLPRATVRKRCAMLPTFRTRPEWAQHGRGNTANLGRCGARFLPDHCRWFHQRDETRRNAARARIVNWCSAPVGTPMRSAHQSSIAHRRAAAEDPAGSPRT
jgi:hypothetical protein